MEIHVPNLINLMKEMMRNNLDINDVWYRAGSFPITFHDVLYGWGQAMRNGNIYYAHKCGFTPLSLYEAVKNAGFKEVGVADQGSNLMCVGVKNG